MTSELLARLDSFDIRVISQGQIFWFFAREGCLILVKLAEGMYIPRGADPVFDSIGSAGISLDKGLGYLVYKDEGPMLVGNEFEQPATPEQVDIIKRFSADLKTALGLP